MAEMWVTDSSIKRGERSNEFASLRKKSPAADYTMWFPIKEGAQPKNRSPEMGNAFPAERVPSNTANENTKVN